MLAEHLKQKSIIYLTVTHLIYLVTNKHTNQPPTKQASYLMYWLTIWCTHQSANTLVNNIMINDHQINKSLLDGCELQISFSFNHHLWVLPIKSSAERRD